MTSKLQQAQQLYDDYVHACEAIGIYPVPAGDNHTALVARIEELQEDIRNLEDFKEELQEDIRNLEDFKEELEREISDLEDDKEELEEDIRNLEDDKEAVDGEGSMT